MLTALNPRRSHLQKTFLFIVTLVCCFLALQLGFTVVKSFVPSVAERLSPASVKKPRSYFNPESLHSQFQSRKRSEIFAHGAPHQKIQSNQADWQVVTGSEYKFSVYSAYSYDEHEVVIIGTTKAFTKEIPACVFHYEMNNETREPRQSTVGKLETMDEHWGKKYGGVFVRCPFPSGRILPHSVSVIVVNGQPANDLGNIIRIQYKSQRSEPPFNFSVCVLPAYKYDEVFHFLEWFEFYKLMGVTHFTLYNVSFGPSISCVLKELEKRSEIVDVHPWHNFPIKDRSEIRASSCAECGLSSGSNDCVYRHKGVSKYMIFLDFDEFILPRSAQDFDEMIVSLDAMNKSVEIGEYSFLNAFFPRARPNDEDVQRTCGEFKMQQDLFTYHVCMHLLTVKKSSRMENVFEHNQRSKYIVKPEAVREAGNHHVITLEPGYNTLVAPPQVAILRHYRFFDAFWDLPADAKLVPDRIAKSFAARLARNVAQQLERFMDTCNLDMSLVFKMKD